MANDINMYVISLSLNYVLQELVAARDPPNFYLDKLKAHMTMKGSKVCYIWSLILIKQFIL